MGIPAIAAYPMPTESELPENTARWAVDPHRAVLLIHDMQKYFIQPFPTGQSPVTELLRNVTALRERCAALDIPVAYTTQPGGMTEQQRGLLRDFWGSGMTVAPEHREVVDPIRPESGDLVLTKWRYSAFHRTRLLESMRALGRDQLIVCGVYAHVGILMTSADAFGADIQPFLVADAIADFSHEYHRFALRYAAERCAMTVTTATVLDQLALPQAGSRI
ncbi:isochorismatase family protein [Streptomyces ipomoeae]|jgi:isochorismate hydrolase|uniref:Isochorismatase family protein n=2 Tax=Streptomyces ipomoeae TaxID=103232 RepID=L1KU91_9ACTN|nr:isochorismatase family protein [Streptomyces ipomoeae]EKX64356.1 isochorismatase family protein [Streptomyces ipomoeae 91-03]MDX2693007.1 isochorismatase family protein [Streptomyces ipomoeae]MDX2820791.1 isochorismatase family protein [Streptomyces ipomoeae]MDX2838513.1 isochorismatase family protein [Streptomyces ipomoeae]MDX2872569.1 isochorismatase family protein [Streptomyces ipomoeae]